MLLTFSKSLFSIVNAPDYTKCISLSNQQCMTQPSFIKLHPNEYTHGLRYYSFAVNLDRCLGSYNTLNDLTNRVCLSNKAEDLNLNLFNLIAEINGSKT